MADPRLNGSHLSVDRFDQYDAAVDEMLDGRGMLTAVADVLARQPTRPRSFIRREAPPPSGTYSLVSFPDGRRHPLRVGINAVGRFPENDVMLHLSTVSRRHCVILVHASGGCEVYDTASRNGTWVNGQRVGRVDLLPGDKLDLAGQMFLVEAEWAGHREELPPPSEGQATACINGEPPSA